MEPGVTTLGIRLSMDKWGFFVDTLRCWNGRFFDFFFALPADVTLQLDGRNPSDKVTLQLMVLVHHPVDQYFCASLETFRWRC